MIQTILIHGRQPALGRAELESLFGAESLAPIGDIASGLTTPDEEVDFNRLGGSIKMARILTVLKTTDWRSVEKYLSDTIPEHLQYVPEGKFKLGLSAYGMNVPVAKINATGLTLKKIIKATGKSVRIIPNKQPELNSAQVLHNRLTGPTGWELIVIKNRNSTLLAQTVAVQDIDAYAARDQARPKRDARVGMLPPKLAQIILNLAAPEGQSTVLDPFCGTGVVLQEALLMGYNAYGTDLDERMVDYTRANLEWLNITALQQRVRQGDATNASWEEPFDVVAAETYLGRPFSAVPKPEIMSEVMHDVDTIHRKFLQNVVRQTKPGFRMCIAVPAWKSKNGFQHLPVLDRLTDMEYTRLKFVHASWDDLIYFRENQIVARELVVLVRN